MSVGAERIDTMIRYALGLLSLHLLIGGCVHQNAYYGEYTLRHGGAKSAIEAYHRDRPTVDSHTIELANHGALHVGMPEGLVRAICGTRLERSGAGWEVTGEFPSFDGYDARNLYLYFDQEKLAAIIVIGWRGSDPL